MHRPLFASGECTRSRGIIILMGEWLNETALNRPQSEHGHVCIGSVRKPDQRIQAMNFRLRLSSAPTGAPEAARRLAVMAPLDSRSPNDRGALQNTLKLWALIWILESQLPYLPWYEVPKRSLVMTRLEQLYIKSHAVSPSKNVFRGRVNSE